MNMEWPDYGREGVRTHFDKDGNIVDAEGKRRSFSFDSPEHWRIVTEWYENIPEGGVLCREGSDGGLDVIMEYKEGLDYPFRGLVDSYNKVTPCTKAEILKWAEAAK